jgi:hypothetical protein
MADQPQQTSKPVRIIKGVLQVVGFFTLLFGGAGKMANAFGLEAIGPAAATFMLRQFGDPCDGVQHPAFQSEPRREIVDAIQEYRDEDTHPLYAVEKVAVKDGWAYIEAAPPDSGQYEAFLLEARNANWVVRWNGAVGAQPGEGQNGNPYPDDFDSSDQDILRCQTVCVVSS